jgi:carboxymethylenebutenolidase
VDVCELVLGNEVEMGLEAGSPQEPVEAYFAKAVKNNNGSGVLLLTDILGIDNEDTRDYAFRLACFGYNVFMPGEDGPHFLDCRSYERVPR